MTPGAYIRDCREAMGLSCEDVALQLDSDPPVSCRSRAELLAAIEADLVPVSLSTALALTTVRIGVDLHHLAGLVDARATEIAGPSGERLQMGAAQPRLRPAGASPLWLNLGGEASA